MDRLVWCNNVICERSCSNGFVSPSTIKRAYKHADPDSPLRTWLTSRNPGLIDIYSDLPEEYYIAFAEKHGLEVDVDELWAVWMRPSCQFHEHYTQDEFNNCVIRVDMHRELKD